MAKHINSHGEVSEVEWSAPGDDVVENYAAVIANRDWSWEDIAATLDEVDKPLADYLRVHGPELYPAAHRAEAPVEGKK